MSEPKIEPFDEEAWQRFELAKEVLRGLLNIPTYYHEHSNITTLAADACDLADAMIAELKKHG